MEELEFNSNSFTSLMVSVMPVKLQSPAVIYDLLFLISSLHYYQYLLVLQVFPFEFYRSFHPDMYKQLQKDKKRRNNALFFLKHCCSHSSFALIIRPAQLTVWSCIVMGCCCRAVTISVGWSMSVAPAGQDRVDGARRRLQTLYKEKQHPSSPWLEKRLSPGKEALWSVNHCSYQHVHLVLHFDFIECQNALYKNRPYFHHN